MKCFYCDKEACAKIGTSKGNIFSALLGRRCWSKTELYVCRKHFIEREDTPTELYGFDTIRGVK